MTDATGRQAFTVLELVIATLIFLVIMGITMTIFFGSSKEYDSLRADLEVNEKVSRAFERIGRDVLEASMVEWPLQVTLENAPPPFEHRSPRDSTGLLVLVVERPLVNAAGNGLDSMQERIVYYLDRPKRLGSDGRGTDVVTYTLLRQLVGHGAAPEGGDAAPSPEPSRGSERQTATSSAPVAIGPPVEIMDGVSELVFYRTVRDPSSGAAGAGAGPAVLYVTLRISAHRQRPDKKVQTGYTAEFSSCFTLRGKDIATRRGDQQGAPQ